MSSLYHSNDFCVEAAVEFIKAFHPEGKATLQVYPDNKDFPEGVSAKTVQVDVLAEFDWTKLVVVNSKGGGVHFTVNKTDGSGKRKAENITGVTALFVDVDGVDPSPEMFATVPQPSIVVQSKRGKHFYWLLNEVQPLDKDTFKSYQQQLAAKLGGDSSVSDLPRVMRLPGFFHRKSEPFKVEMVSFQPDVRYSLSDFGFIEVQQKASEGKDKNVKLGKLEVKLNKLLTELAGVKENRNNALNSIAFQAGLLVHKGLSFNVVYTRLLNLAQTLGLSEAESTRTIESGLNDGEERARQTKTPFAMVQDATKELIESRLRFNVLTQTFVLDGKDISLDKLLLYVRSEVVVCAANGKLGSISKGDAEDIIKDIATDNSFSPIVEYLNGLEIPSVVELLPTLADKLFGTSDHLSRTMLIKWLVGAIKRQMEPGCQMDSALVLKGGQGIGKTSFFRTIGLGIGYNTLGGNDKGKDELMKLAGSWIIEYGEIESAFKAKDISEIKHFLTENHDTYRMPYARGINTVPRSCVFCGSTNQDTFLADDTGSRRFWVIDLGSNEIPIAWLKQNLDQVWAEAMKLYLDGETCYLNKDDQKRLDESNKAFETEDPLETTLSMALSLIDRVNGNTAFTSTQVMELLKLQPNKGNQMRLSRLMKALGYESERVRYKGIQARYWIKPEWEQETIKYTETCEMQRLTEYLTRRLIQDTTSKE